MRKLLVFFILFFITRVLLGQDPQFTQFYASPLYLSPSFAGSTKGKRIVTNYRNQWPALKESFVTYAFSYDHYLPSLNSGLGVQFIREQAGTGALSTTNAGLVYSYHVEVTHNWRFIPGIHFMYTQRGLDFNKLTFGDQLVGDYETTVEVPPQQRAWDVDATASALAFSDRIWFGVTVDHLLQPNRSLTGDKSIVPMRYSVFGGMRIPIQQKYNRQPFESLFPAFLFKKQGKNTQMNVGVYWHNQPFMLGLWYRGLPVFKKYPSNDAIAIMAGYRIDQFNIGYSYDVTISNLAGMTQGAHEISLIFKFGEYQTPREKWQVNPCPGL
jgi:type IX secretion system PorP/SprF family membrane protein